MSLVTTDRAILGHFNTQWGTTTPVSWDNIPYTPTAGTSFIEVKHRPNGKSTSIGRGCTRRFGLVSVNVYQAVGTTPQSGLALADSVETIFDDADISGITFYSPRTTTVGQVDGWYVTNITVDYRKDEYPA